MIQTKCLNGHYFDCEEYEFCPICGAVSIEKDKRSNGEKKKSGLFSLFKQKTPVSEVETKMIPTGKVDKTVGIMSRERIEEKPDHSDEINERTDNNLRKSDFNFVDEMYKEVDPIVTDATAEYERKVNSASRSETEPDPVNDTNNVKQRSELEKQLESAQAKTVGFFSANPSVNSTKLHAASIPVQENDVSIEPVVGWLVCIKGVHIGECFNIYSGKSSMGRSSNNRIVFSKDEKISREKHAFVMYEPKKREFFLQSGDSSGLTYLNDENLIGSSKLSSFDVIELGDSRFLFLPLCSEKFAWEDYL